MSRILLYCDILLVGLAVMGNLQAGEKPVLDKRDWESGYSPLFWLHRLFLKAGPVDKLSQSTICINMEKT